MTNKTHRSCAASGRGHERTIFPASNGLCCAPTSFQFFPLSTHFFGCFHFVGLYISISISAISNRTVLSLRFGCCCWGVLCVCFNFPSSSILLHFLSTSFLSFVVMCGQLDNRFETNKHKELWPLANW